jgi:PAS domain S-box-containing protein
VSRTIVCYQGRQPAAQQVFAAVRESRTPGRAPGRGFEGWKGCGAMFNDGTAFPDVTRGTADVTIPAAQYESLRLLSSIVGSSDDAIVSATLQGRVMSWNRGAERIFGYTTQEMMGRPLMRLTGSAADNDLRWRLAQVGRGEESGSYETVRCCKSGKHIPVSATMSPLRDAANRIIGVAEISRDVSDREQAERSDRIHERLKAMARLASRLAHDINNPLTSVTNLLFLLETEVLSPEGAHYVSIAQRELRRVAGISAQALNLYHITGDPESISIHDIADDVLAEQEDRCQTMGIHVVREYRVVPRIRCYVAELRQVLTNLVGNAVDAMPGGGHLRLRICECRDWAGRGRCLRITLGDTGRGMSAETRRRLFEPFFTTRQATGTGLGLWGCAHVVTRYGGRILVRTRQNGGCSGSVFVLLLPL